MHFNFTESLLEADDHEHDQAESTNTVKIITMVALFFISMGSGMIPLALSKCFNWSDPNRDPRTNKIISSLLSFGGGALLATTLMHLLPEIDENISSLQKEGRMPEWDFSITNLLMAIGFFIIYLVEEIVHAYLRRRQSKAQDAFVRAHSPRESLREAASRQPKPNNGTITLSTADLVENEQIENQHRHDAHHNSHSHHTHSHNHHHHHHHSHIPSVNGDDLLVSSIRGLLIVLALSVHELFEGLAVGLEKTNSNVWFMFASVSAHKVFFIKTLWNSLLIIIISINSN